MAQEGVLRPAQRLAQHPEPGKPLLIRTLLEKSCEEIFLNKVAVETIVAAARKTTERNPLLPLPKEDYWYYLNAVLNEWRRSSPSAS